MREFLLELIEQEVTEALQRLWDGRAEGGKSYRQGHRPWTVIRSLDRVQGDFKSWNQRRLEGEPVLPLIVDGTLVHARLDRHSRTLSILHALFLAIAQVPLGKRPARIEPRVVRQGPKAFPRLNTTRRRARRNTRLHGHPERLEA
ncbi:MAG: hypothetical protein ACYCUE_06590 [Steroidobacteraceae bacterium]